MSGNDTLALRALALRLLADRVKAADAANRADICGTYRVKNREVVWLPLNGIDVEIGQVRLDKGAVSASVVNMGDLIDWCEQNYPSEVEEYAPAPVTRVRPAFLTRLLADAKAAGAAVDGATGEVVPGITVATGDPGVKVVPVRAPDAEAALMTLIATDPFALGSLLALPAGAE